MVWACHGASWGVCDGVVWGMCGVVWTCVGRCACEVWELQRCGVVGDDVHDWGVRCEVLGVLCDGRYGVCSGGVCQWCSVVKVHVW